MQEINKRRKEKYNRESSILRARVETDNSYEDELFNLTEIIVKLRYHQKNWDNSFGGGDWKAKKRKWEEKADEWILNHVKEELIPENINLENAGEIEIYCSHFGCGRKLKLTEKLCGTKCTKHMGKEQTVYFNGLI